MKIPTTTDIPQRYTWCLAGICYSSLAILPSFLSYAESYFNPAFLLENGTSVADLSRCAFVCRYSEINQKIRRGRSLVQQPDQKPLTQQGLTV